MEPLPIEFYVHDCLISPVTYEDGTGGGQNPTYNSQRSPIPCKFQQSARTQGWNMRDAMAMSMGAVVDRTDGTMRFPTDPAVKRDDRAAIYTRPESGSPVLLLTVQMLGTAVPLRYADDGSPGSYVADIQIVN